MARRKKSLTFKKPDPKKMKLIGIIFVISFLVFPGVRYSTGSAFHMVGNIIQSTAR